MTGENVRPFTPTKTVSDGRRRQLRQQGFADGKTGRRARWPSEPEYAASYRRGAGERGNRS